MRLDPKVCALAWEGPTLAFLSAGPYALALENPHPDKPIREILPASSGTVAGHVGVVAVTLSDAAPDLMPLAKEGEAEKRMPEGEFEPSPLYRYVADRWNYNPNKYRQW